METVKTDYSNDKLDDLRLKLESSKKNLKDCLDCFEYMSYVGLFEVGVIGNFRTPKSPSMKQPEKNTYERLNLLGSLSSDDIVGLEHVYEIFDYNNRFFLESQYCIYFSVNGKILFFKSKDDFKILDINLFNKNNFLINSYNDYSKNITISQIFKKNIFKKYDVSCEVNKDLMIKIDSGIEESDVNRIKKMFFEDFYRYSTNFNDNYKKILSIRKKIRDQERKIRDQERKIKFGEKIDLEKIKQDELNDIHQKYGKKINDEIRTLLKIKDLKKDYGNNRLIIKELDTKFSRDIVREKTGNSILHGIFINDNPIVDLYPGLTIDLYNPTNMYLEIDWFAITSLSYYPLNQNLELFCEQDRPMYRGGKIWIFNKYEEFINRLESIERYGVKRWFSRIRKDGFEKTEINYYEIDKIINTIDEVFFKYYLENEKEKPSEEEVIKTTKNVEYDVKFLDKDNNGVLDLIDIGNDFMKLLEKNQPNIVKVEKDYIHKFVRLDNYLNTMRDNLQVMFKIILNTELVFDKEELINVLKLNIENYNLLLFHSLNMIVSIGEKTDFITFYQIYEVFDKLNVFNSNWENELSINLQKINNKLGSMSSQFDSINEKLKSVIKGIDTLTDEVREVGNEISSQIIDLKYMNRESFVKLNKNVSSELKSINSSIKFNNLLTGIQTYQMYKINKNTKSLK